MKLANKVALITGGAQGLGKAIALAMANEGAMVVICDINPKTLPEAWAEIEATGARCLDVKCDVSSVESVADLFRATVAAFGTLDILVNSAALLQTGAKNEEMRSKFYKMMTMPVPKESLGVTRDFPDEEWHKYWGDNVHGVFYCYPRGAANHGAEEVRQDHQHRLDRWNRRLQRLPSVLLCDQGRRPRVHSLRRRRSGPGANAIACGGVLTPPMEAYLASLSEGGRNRSISRFRWVAWDGRRSMPRSPSISLSDGHYLVGQTISPNGGMIV